MVTETLDAPYSHYLLDADLSREIDRRTIEEMGIEGFTLMEVAGASAAKALLRDINDFSHGLYLCGKGNNGGDALVIARYLLQNGIDATIVFISGTDDLSPDARKNFSLLKRFDFHNKVNVFENWDDFNQNENFDFIIDGMLGTGLDSDVRGAYVDAVQWTNKQEVPIWAIDIPTGLNADSGEIMGCAVKAHRTFAFGSRKRGFYLDEGPTLTGSIDYCELPFPNEYFDSCSTYLLDESWVRMNSPMPGRHKYDSGILYIIAGSEGLTGAAILAAQSAWAEGLGAVILICPRGVLPIYEHNLPSVIKKPVGRHNDYFFKNKHAEKVLNIVREKEGKVLLGPGLGRDKATVRFVKQFIAENDTDMVIDADGLWCLSRISKWEKPQQTNWILSPHPGELKTLTGEEDLEDSSHRLEIVRNYARELNVTILSKGMPGVVGTPSGNCYLTNYNTRYFSRAGSGDVLAGKISAYFALGNAADHSCAMGLLHGKQRLDYFMNHHKELPEPKDFI